MIHIFLEEAMGQIRLRMKKERIGSDLNQELRRRI